MNGVDAASQGPVQSPGGISYDETAYAKNAGLPVASVVNAAGNAVQPTSQNTVEALQGATLNADLTENLGGVFDDTASDAYPLSAYSYLVTQCVPTQAAAQNVSCDGNSNGNVTMGASQGSELSQFITYIACLGQSRMANLGYAPLPPNLVEDAFQAVGRLPGGTTPPPPTAESCPNPTIAGGTSSISPVGSLISQASAGGTTLSVPSPTVGNAWVLAVQLSSPSITVSSITGGGVHGTWTRLTQVGDPAQRRDVEEWLGPISQTGSGSSAITVDFSSDVSETRVELDAQQFTAGGGGSSVWEKDVAGSAESDTASSTVTFPALAPAGPNELYVGFSRATSGSSSGTSSGFTYDSPTASNLYIYDPSVSSGVSPTANATRRPLHHYRSVDRRELERRKPARIGRIPRVRSSWPPARRSRHRAPPNWARCRDSGERPASPCSPRR